jgi:hypothetical protein
MPFSTEEGLRGTAQFTMLGTMSSFVVSVVIDIILLQLETLTVTIFVVVRPSYKKIATVWFCVTLGKVAQRFPL